MKRSGSRYNQWPRGVELRLMLAFFSPIKSELLAIAKNSGEIAWRTSLPKGRCHATPVHLRREGTDKILLPNDNQLACFDLSTGKQQWTLQGLPRVPTATPVVDGDFVYYNMTSRGGDADLVEPVSFAELLEAHDTNKDDELRRNEIPDSLAVLTRHRPDTEGDFGFKKWFFRDADRDRDGAIVESEWTTFFENMKSRRAVSSQQENTIMAIRLPGDDTAAPQITWKMTKGVPEVPSLLVHDGRIYAIRNGGILVCYRTEDGEMLYRSRVGAAGGYYASPVTDGKHVFLASLAGTITILLPDDTFRRVGSIVLGEPINATPAIVDGTLYVRTDEHLYAFAD